MEPTLSGIHDLERSLSLLNHFKIPPLICVNKADLNTENTAHIITFCEHRDLRVVGPISFDPLVTKSMVAGKPMVEYAPASRVSNEIKDTWERLLAVLITSDFKFTHNIR